jgi:mycofactocin precursor
MAESAASVERAPVDLTTPAPADEDLILEDDLLVEDVSIDGMCGVY